MNAHFLFLLVWMGRIVVGIVLLMILSLVYVAWEDSRPLEKRTKLSDKTLRNDAEQVFTKNDACARQQYQNEPEFEFKGKYNFHPKPEYSHKCPILVIYLDPYSGSFAGGQKIYPNISP